MMTEVLRATNQQTGPFRTDRVSLASAHDGIPIKISPIAIS
nr:hypothetical protein [Candidatus Njordarchaeota archaeon]